MRESHQSPKKGAAPTEIEEARKNNECTEIIRLPASDRNRCRGCRAPMHRSAPWLCRTCLGWHWSIVYLEAARNALAEAAR